MEAQPIRGRVRKYLYKRFEHFWHHDPNGDYSTEGLRSKRQLSRKPPLDSQPKTGGARRFLINTLSFVYCTQREGPQPHNAGLLLLFRAKSLQEELRHVGRAAYEPP